MKLEASLTETPTLARIQGQVANVVVTIFRKVILSLIEVDRAEALTGRPHMDQVGRLVDFNFVDLTARNKFFDHFSPYRLKVLSPSRAVH